VDCQYVWIGQYAPGEPGSGRSIHLRHISRDLSTSLLFRLLPTRCRQPPDRSDGTQDTAVSDKVHASLFGALTLCGPLRSQEPAAGSGNSFIALQQEDLRVGPDCHVFIFLNFIPSPRHIQSYYSRSQLHVFLRLRNVRSTSRTVNSRCGVFPQLNRDARPRLWTLLLPLQEFSCSFPLILSFSGGTYFHTSTLSPLNLAMTLWLTLFT